MNKLIVKRSYFDSDSAKSPFEITVFDTAIGSQNRGDQIISNAVYKLLESMFPHAHLWSLPTHDTYGAAGRKRQRHSLFSITTGTNLLAQDMPSRGLWKVPRFFRIEPLPFGYLHPKNLVLCATGSNAKELSASAQRFLGKSLWSDVPVSARDKRTKEILDRASITNSLHTSCVTLWSLQKDHASRVPKKRARDVVVTVTGTRRASKDYIAVDQAMFDILRKKYDVVYFWPQGQVDLEYVAMLGLEGITILESNLGAFTKLLIEAPSLDYVGSRLHAGIHAIQHDRRSLIIPVDNRASDISASIGLPTLAGQDICRLNEMIEGEWETKLDLPWENIETWKSKLIDSVRKALSPEVDLSQFAKYRD